MTTLEQVSLLLFYYGASPRQLIAWRCCCRRWATLLREDRFWRRHHAALHQRWPRLSLALARAVPRRPELTLCAWYEAVSGAVRRYFDKDEKRTTCRALWEALLLAACGESIGMRHNPGASGSTHITRPDDKSSLTIAALRWREYSANEMQLRRAGGRGRSSAKRTSPYVLVWRDGARMPDVEPQRLVYRLLTLLMWGSGSGVEDKDPLL